MWVSSLHLSMLFIPNLEIVFISSKLVWWEWKSLSQRGRMLLNLAAAYPNLWQQFPGHSELSRCQKLLPPRPLSTDVAPALPCTFPSLPMVHTQDQWHSKLTSVALHSTRAAPQRPCQKMLCSLTLPQVRSWPLIKLSKSKVWQWLWK